jgi:hypothetical protein
MLIVSEIIFLRYFDIVIQSLDMGNCSIVLSGKVSCPSQRWGHYTSPENIIWKLLTREKTLIFIVHNISSGDKDIAELLYTDNNHWFFQRYISSYLIFF